MTKWLDKTQDTALNLKDRVQNIFAPTIRLGVTGLSRSGKTIFITAMINHLLAGRNLPFFSPLREGRIKAIYLEPQPDDILPRFDYEGHIDKLTQTNPQWPEGTKWISQLRLTILYRPTGLLSLARKTSKLHIDIVDYPGEWLLDLPLLDKSYQQWSSEALDLARQPVRQQISHAWLAAIDNINSETPIDEGRAKKIK